jgi:hypothetical protein
MCDSFYRDLLNKPRSELTYVTLLSVFPDTEVPLILSQVCFFCPPPRLIEQPHIFSIASYHLQYIRLDCPQFPAL